MAGRGSIERTLCFNQEVAHDFGEALQNKYNGIQFVACEYWKSQKPQDKSAPPRFEVPHFDSLGDQREFQICVWIEPDGWKPFWKEKNKNGICGLANQPRLQFTFHRSDLFPLGSRLCKNVREIGDTARSWEG
jgi:hypothetical protein